MEDYPYFLDELKNLNMLVTRAATDEEYANSVEKLYMSFQQLNRAFNTDEENVREQLDRINGMLKGQQFGPRGGRLSLHVDFHPIDRQFKSSLGRIMSKLDDWTRNARSNPMETRKAFAGCETFIGRLQAELGRSATRTASRNTVRATSIHACAARSTRSCTITICPTNASAPPAASPAARCRNSPRSSTARP